MKLSNIKPSNSTDRSPRPQTVPRLAGMLVLVWLAFLTAARAVSPPPDGGYPNGNTAEGDNALFNLTDGINNTANGFDALFSNTTGNWNTAVGREALLNNTTGSNNTATGESALFENTTGSGNIALGFSAGSNLTTGSNNIDIGNAGVAGESGTIRIGTGGTQTATFIAGISGATIPGGVG